MKNTKGVFIVQNLIDEWVLFVGLFNTHQCGF